MHTETHAIEFSLNKFTALTTRVFSHVCIVPVISAFLVVASLPRETMAQGQPELYDDFNDAFLNPTLWGAFGSASETEGKAWLQSGATVGNSGLLATRRLLGMWCQVHPTYNVGVGGHVDFSLHCYTATGDSVEIGVLQNNHSLGNVEQYIFFMWCQNGDCTTPALFVRLQEASPGEDYLFGLDLTDEGVVRAWLNGRIAYSMWVPGAAASYMEGGGGFMFHAIVVSNPASIEAAVDWVMVRSAPILVVTNVHAAQRAGAKLVDIA
jgi:hypothetical protein